MGAKIRMKSSLIRSMREDQERAQKNRLKGQEKVAAAIGAADGDNHERPEEAKLTNLEGLKKEYEV